MSYHGLDWHVWMRRPFGAMAPIEQGDVRPKGVCVLGGRGRSTRLDSGLDVQSGVIGVDADGNVVGLGAGAAAGIRELLESGGR